MTAMSYFHLCLLWSQEALKNGYLSSFTKMIVADDNQQMMKTMMTIWLWCNWQLVLLRWSFGVVSGHCSLSQRDKHSFRVGLQIPEPQHVYNKTTLCISTTKKECTAISSSPGDWLTTSHIQISVTLHALKMLALIIIIIKQQAEKIMLSCISHASISWLERCY